MKKDLRLQGIRWLKEQSPFEKQERDETLCQLLCHSYAYQSSHRIATYLSFAHEFDTSLFIARALKDGKEIFIPKTYPKGKMIFVAYDEDDLKKTSFGLKEPKSSLEVVKDSLDMIHVPGVVFNNTGFRIGYGGGYYDRYLYDFKGQTVSTIYPFQIQNFVEERHDIPVGSILKSL